MPSSVSRSLAFALRRITCACAAALAVACAPLREAEPPPPPPKPPEPVTVYVPLVEPADANARHLLAYQDRLSQLSPGDLAQEVARLGDGSASPQAAMDLALALGQTRGNGDLARAQGLLDQVLRNTTPETQAWHPLARLLQVRYAEQRRAEEQAERLNQQLRDSQRDNQRKLDQLNEKLEALKAIERSLNSRPAPGPAASGPKP